MCYISQKVLSEYGTEKSILARKIGGNFFKKTGHEKEMVIFAVRRGEKQQRGELVQRRQG